MPIPAPRTPSQAHPIPLDRTTIALEEAIVTQTNRARVAHGAPPVALDPRLAEVARAHSRDMAARRYFDHVDPEGRGPGDRLARGYPELVGESSENLYCSRGICEAPSITAARVVRGWLDSPGHRANLLRVSSTHVGVGLFASGTSIVATQLFARPALYMDAPWPATARASAALPVRVRRGVTLANAGAIEVLLAWPDRVRRFPIAGRPGAVRLGADVVEGRRTPLGFEGVARLGGPGVYRLLVGTGGELVVAASVRAV